MRVQELTKQYDGKTVVDGVSFAIPKGKVISLIGPNGAGKSTVMGMISRLIAHDSGLIDFEGKDIGKWKSKELSKRLAILTQSNNIQMKLTVRELVTFGRFPYSGNRVTPEDQKIIDRAIHYMELEEFQDRFIDELSGGQRQRALIAMVIAQDTEYVLLDEPTNNLDIYHATNMMKIVRRLCDELGKTVILVLHEINYAAFYSDYLRAAGRFGWSKVELQRKIDSDAHLEIQLDESEIPCYTECDSNELECTEHDQDTFSLPRQYLQKPDGRVYHEGSGEESRSGAEHSNRVGGYQHRGDRQSGVSAGSPQAVRAWHRLLRQESPPAAEKRLREIRPPDWHGSCQPAKYAAHLRRRS